MATTRRKRVRKYTRIQRRYAWAEFLLCWVCAKNGVTLQDIRGRRQTKQLRAVRREFALLSHKHGVGSHIASSMLDRKPHAIVYHIKESDRMRRLLRSKERREHAKRAGTGAGDISGWVVGRGNGDPGAGAREYPVATAPAD